MVPRGACCAGVCEGVGVDFFLPMQKRRTYVSATPSNSKRRPRVNDEIRVPRVLLVDEDGKTEVVPVEQAIARAREAGVDLVEVSPKADPPVVKLANLGRYLYQLQKKERKQRSRSHQTEVKTLRFGFRTDQHDLDRLIARAREFLAERHLVKFMVRLRGRELTNKEYAQDKLRKVVAALLDTAEIEQDMKRQGNAFLMIIRPKR